MSAFDPKTEAQRGKWSITAISPKQSPSFRRAGRPIAFYIPGGGHCTINVVVWDRTDASGDSAARVRVSLNPSQMVHIDSAENKSINLQCGDSAETLALVDTSKFVAAGAAE
jgi:hypothetical protein